MRQASLLKLHHGNVSQVGAEDLVPDDLIQNGLEFQDANAIDEVGTFFDVLVMLARRCGVHGVGVRAQCCKVLLDFAPVRVGGNSDEVSGSTEDLRYLHSIQERLCLMTGASRVGGEEDDRSAFESTAFFLSNPVYLFVQIIKLVCVQFLLKFPHVIKIAFFYLALSIYSMLLHKTGGVEEWRPEIRTIMVQTGIEFLKRTDDFSREFSSRRSFV
jgi:hypothetical protein